MNNFKERILCAAGFVLISDLSVVEGTFDMQEVSYEYRQSRNILPNDDRAAKIHYGANRPVQFCCGLILSYC